jgi:SPP1 gp7 family putative phage head morphogenesis protein
MRYEAEMSRRFRRLQREIREYLVQRNSLQINADFDFPTDARKVAQFTAWLKRQSRLIVLGGPPVSGTNKSWQSMYIDSAYQRGLAASAKKMMQQGAQIKDTYLDSAFFRPRHIDAVGLIYTRTYSDLEGITATMDARISKSLATSLGEGLGAVATARELNDVVSSIGLVRARALARTETIAAYAKASINSYRDAGLEGVQAEVEFATARDNAVCPECEDLEGKVYSLDEADGVIPVHPNCRCSWIPVVGADLGITLE